MVRQLQGEQETNQYILLHHMKPLASSKRQQQENGRPSEVCESSILVQIEPRSAERRQSQAEDNSPESRPTIGHAPHIHAQPARMETLLVFIELQYYRNKRVYYSWYAVDCTRAGGGGSAVVLRDKATGSTVESNFIDGTDSRCRDSSMALSVFNPHNAYRYSAII